MPVADLGRMGSIRARAKLEARMIEEETAARITELIEQRVQEVMGSDAVQLSLKARLEAERKDLEEQVWQWLLQCHTM